MVLGWLVGDHDRRVAAAVNFLVQACGTVLLMLGGDRPVRLRRGPLDRSMRPAGTEIGPGRAAMVRAPGVGGQEPARMGRADFETWEPVERTLKDQMRESDGGLERIADHVAAFGQAIG
jgi:hypothetical protein